MENKIRGKGGWLITLIVVSATLIVVGGSSILLWGTGSEKCKPLMRFERSTVKFNTPINLIFYSQSPENASLASQAVFRSIDKLKDIFTDYHAESELRRLCENSDGKTAIKVSKPLYWVLDRAVQVSQDSEGAFDVTVGPVTKLWRRAIRKRKLPDPDRLAEAQKRVGYQLIHLNPEDRTVLLEKPDMQIDLGGIAKGYMIDQALAIFREHGIDRALVDIGGDIGLSAPPLEKTGWTISIAPLEKRGHATFSPFCRLKLANCTIATSGDTERFVEIEGRRYSHLIDPRTGIGISDHSNVTVIARDAMTADALASAVSILGPTEGLKLIERTSDAEALILRKPVDSIEVYKSTGFPEKCHYSSGGRN